MRLVRLLACLILGFVVLSWLPVLLLRWVPPPTSAFMLERRVSAIHQHDTRFTLAYQWRSWSDISRQLPLAVVASEDQRFPNHHGFDLDAIQDALASARSGKRLRGASTISQQTAKNLFLWSGRSFVRKGLEAWFTTLIELSWPKQRILEVYVNIAEMGDGVYGAEAASKRFFGIPASELNTRQAATLAAVLPSPRRMHADRPSPQVQHRAQWIEQQMHQLGGTSYIDFGAAASSPQR